jgi:3-oxoacyl-[acyl-carrier protein] reductase
MNLNLENKLFIVPGATSGFGHSILTQLLDEGAKVIGIARTAANLEELKKKYPKNLETICGDISQDETIRKVFALLGIRKLAGVLINAGGPPAKSFVETNMEDWDDAYQKLLRWKVAFVKTFLPVFQKQKFGRFVFIESSSVKQPVENLILSTSLRLAVVGMAKTLSEEHAQEGITFNVMAPSYHETPAVNRLFEKKASNFGISFEEAKSQVEKGIKTGKMGSPDDFGSLALWLFSEKAGFVTGQVYALDGGVIKSTL